MTTSFNMPNGLEMRPYIGTKLIRATPMTLGEYNQYRGWEMPQDEHLLTSGYLVEYEATDSDKKNHPDHQGYISWSPADVFEKSYMSVFGGMTFGQAIDMMLRGKRVQRRGWNGKGMFLYLVKGSTFAVNRPPLNEFYEEGTKIDYRPHIDMKDAEGKCVPWLASQTDMLAEDWIVVVE